MARRLPVGSRTSISKILKRGRRVGRMPQLNTSPATDADTPGRSDAMVWKWPRSSYRVGKRYRRSSIAVRPARAKSAARRGPTPFRYWSEPWSGSLDNRRDALPDPDFLNRGGQRERLVQVDAGRILRGLGVVTEQLLQERLRNGDAGDLRRLELE